MALFAPKKTRTHRTTALRPAPTISGRLDETLRNRRVAPRLVVCAVALIGLIAAVEGWKVPFRYRLGDRPPHGIAAQRDFRMPNPARTERAQRDAEERVPFVFRHDVGVLRTDPAAELSNLALQFRNHLRDVAEAKTVADLAPATRTAFGLTDGGDAADPLDKRFGVLKVAVSASEESPGNWINELALDFDHFLGPLHEYGVVSPDELARHSLPANAPILIIAPGQSEPRSGVAGEVQLSEMLKDTGLLGKSWNLHPNLAGIRPLLETWLIRQSPVTLRYDVDETQRRRVSAREAVEEQYDPYKRGDMLVGPGEIVNDQRLALLQAEYETIERNVLLRQRLIRVATVLLMLLVLAVLYGYYLTRNERRLTVSIGRLSLYLGTIVVAVFLSRIFSYDPWRAEIVPLMATMMVFAIAHNQMLATLTAFLMALIITLSTVGDLGQFVVMMCVTATAITPLRRVASRSSLIKVGFWAAAAYFLVAWGHGIIRSHAPGEVWSDTTLLWNSLRGAGWCLVAGYLVAGSLPFIEQAFDVVTDISLLEMSDISHPLLQELVHRAPGTYNHSISVASIGETAADAIGANGLLVRVGAYFHDIGKMLKPQYFIENMTAGTQSRHEHLAPAMSTLIIIGHVKDGVDLAKQFNLPPRIIDFIEQHHGTTLVEYFYREAARQAEGQPDHKTDAEESSFRYPGPKPQTRETGVIMLADAVESASRTLSEPTSKRIESLVHEITMKRLLDGQFDECSLTLKQIRTVEESLIKSLIGIYHGRIKYPEQRTA